MINPLHYIKKCGTITIALRKDLILWISKLLKDTIIGDILDVDFDCAPYFLEMGMHCLGCPSARGETIEQACEVHGVDPQELVDKLNDYFKNK